MTAPRTTSRSLVRHGVRRGIAAVAALGLLAGLTACDADSGGTTTSSSRVTPTTRSTVPSVDPDGIRIGTVVPYTGPRTGDRPLLESPTPSEEPTESAESPTSDVVPESPESKTPSVGNTPAQQTHTQREGQSGRTRTETTQTGATQTADETASKTRDTGHTCTTLGLVGDSTSVEFSDQNLTTVTPGHTGWPIDALADIGVRRIEQDLLPGRSFHEGAAGTNGIRAIEKITDRLGRQPDCWLFIMGTNDAANITVGSATDAVARADAVMAATGSTPVVWASPLVGSHPTTTGYDPVPTDRFSRALNTYAAEHPRMHVVRMKPAFLTALGTHGLPDDLDDVFISDHIHYTGGAVTTFRMARMADGLRHL